MSMYYHVEYIPTTRGGIDAPRQIHNSFEQTLEAKAMQCEMMVNSLLAADKLLLKKL